MSFDGVLLRRALAEVEGALAGARVERVYQPEERLVRLLLYLPGRGEAGLVVGLDPALLRLHASGQEFANPPQPPVFCMVLRKHLLGARLAAARQEGLERVAVLEFARRDGPAAQLVVELLPRAPNAILVGPDGRVLDALRRDDDPQRPLRPGAPFAPRPPRPGWRPGAPTAELAAALAAQGTRPAWRALVAAAPGVGPDLAREACLACGLEPEEPLPPGAAEPLARALAERVEAALAGAVPPTAAWRDGLPVAVAAAPLPLLAARLGAELRTYASAGALADAVYGALAAQRRAQGLRDALRQVLARERQRAERRLAARLEDLRGLEDPECLRRQAELLAAQLHRVPRGAAVARVSDLYDPEQGEVEIPLDPALSPADNVQRLFERYRRARRAAEAVREKLEEARRELEYLESLAFALEQAEGPEDLEGLRAELAAAGLWPSGEARRPAPTATPGAGPLRLRSRDGWTLLVGRNNRENERVTFQEAAPDDWWLHAKDVAGAHVVCKPPGGRPADLPPATLEDAALLAAYFSRARQGANVPVDVTRVRHVRRLRGGRPGMVLYEGHRTVFVTPDPQRVQELLRSARA